MKIFLVACMCTLLGVGGGMIIGRNSAPSVKIEGIEVISSEGMPSAEVISAINGEMGQRLAEIVGSDREQQHFAVVTSGKTGFEFYMIGPSDSKIWKVGNMHFSGLVHERINELRNTLPAK